MSHDRAFLNNVVTSTLVFEGAGRVIEYAGGYDDWLVQRQGGADNAPRRAPPRPKPRPKPVRQRRLGFNEQRELEGLPRKIEALEAEHAALTAEMSDPAFYQKEGIDISAAKSRLEELEKEIDAAYSRWEALENILQSGE